MPPENIRKEEVMFSGVIERNSGMKWVNYIFSVASLTNYFYNEGKVQTLMIIRNITLCNNIVQK